ncbi:type II secretion system F family protein [Candidatus Woesearchaeota archaeon]|nr:type II secretion system F family protein [Candidatus Woesearchaeota archaeon]
MKFKLRHMIGIALGIFLLIFAIIVLLPEKSRWFKPMLGVAFFVGVCQFWFDLLQENKRNKEIEEKFLEFVRGVSDGVKSGIPIPKSIVELGSVNYGALTPYVKKLVYQIEWGIPLREAFMRFAADTNNKLVKRSMAIIVEAEQSGGHIDQVLQSVTSSVLQIKKIKEERRSNIFSQIIQGYLIFIMFVGIMIVLQVYLMPQLTNMSGTVLAGVTTGTSSAGSGSTTIFPSSIDFDMIFTFLLLIQGFFSGLMIGKFAEGSIKHGLKHSLILMLIGYLAFTIAVGF